MGLESTRTHSTMADTRPPSLPPTDALLDLLPDMVCMVDEDGCILYANAAFEALLGYEPHEVLGRLVFDLMHPDDRAATRRQADAVMAGAVQRHFRNRYLHKLGHSVDMQWSARWAPEHGVRIGIGREVGELRRVERELEHRASHDPLTDLPNRHHLRVELQRAIERAEQSDGALAVLYLDLDGFKATNDRAGHDAGDRILKEVAQRLKAGMRQTDLLARVGGDEFVVLLPGCRDARGASGVAEALRERLRPPFTLPDGPAVLDASIGVACFPGDGRDAETLLVQADRQMYAAKQAKAGPPPTACAAAAK